MLTEHYRKLAADYFPLDITAVTRWWPPASASQSVEPVWVAIGMWQGASRALWGFSIWAF